MKKLILLSTFILLSVVGLNAQNDFRKMNWGDSSNDLLEKYENISFTKNNTCDGYKNFAVIVFKFNSLEFLYLKSSGHRRALHSWDDEYSSTWLVP